MTEAYLDIQKHTIAFALLPPYPTHPAAMDNWSNHPAIADDEGPHTPIIPETNVTETMRFRDRIASFLESRAPRCTASAIEEVERPASALSARSSIHIDVDAPRSDSGSVPSDGIANVLKRDENACRLCGAVTGNQQPLKVARLIWQTNEEHNSLVSLSVSLFTQSDANRYPTRSSG